MEIEGTGHYGGLQAPFDEPSASDVQAADEDTARGRSSSAKKSGGAKASKKKAASDADGSESDKGAAVKHRRHKRPKGPRKGGGSKSHRHGGKGGRRAGHGHGASGSGGRAGRASKGRRDDRGPSSNGVVREEFPRGRKASSMSLAGLLPWRVKVTSRCMTASGRSGIPTITSPRNMKHLKRSTWFPYRPTGGL